MKELIEIYQNRILTLEEMLRCGYEKKRLQIKIGVYRSFINEMKQELELHNVSKSYSIDEVKKAVDHWAITEVPKSSIEKLLDVC